MIDVHVNKMYEASGQTSMERDPVERSGMSLRQRWKGPLKCLPCTAILVERWDTVCACCVHQLNCLSNLFDCVVYTCIHTQN